MHQVHLAVTETPFIYLRISLSLLCEKTIPPKTPSTVSMRETTFLADRKDFTKRQSNNHKIL